MNKILLITGGTGSFGSAVLKRFINDDRFAEIRIFSRDEKIAGQRQFEVFVKIGVNVPFHREGHRLCGVTFYGPLCVPISLDSVVRFIRRPTLTNTQAAVHNQSVPIDEARIVASQPNHCFGNIERLPVSLYRLHVRQA